MTSNIVFSEKKQKDMELSLIHIFSELAGHHVKLYRPQKGEKKALVDMAAKDVIEMVKTIDERAEAARERKQSLGSEVFAVLKEMNAASGEYDGRDFRAEDVYKRQPNYYP